LLSVFNDHFGTDFGLESLRSLACMNRMGPREYLAKVSHRETVSDRIWFNLPFGRKAFLRKATPKAS